MLYFARTRFDVCAYASSLRAGFVLLNFGVSLRNCRGICPGTMPMAQPDASPDVSGRETRKFRIFHVLLHDQAPRFVFPPPLLIEWKASAVTHPGTLSIFFSPSRTSVPFHIYPRLYSRQRSAPRHAWMSISNLLSFPFFAPGRPVTIPGFGASRKRAFAAVLSISEWQVSELKENWNKEGEREREKSFAVNET